MLKVQRFALNKKLITLCEDIYLQFYAFLRCPDMVSRRCGGLNKVWWSYKEVWWSSG